MKKWLDLAWRAIVLYIGFMVLFAVTINLATPPNIASMLTPEQAARSAATLPLVGLLMTGVLIYLTLRARWHGWKLAGALALIFYGIHTFMSQIETAIFPAVANRLPPGMLRGFFLADLLFTIPFALLLVWVLRKTKAAAGSAQTARLEMPTGEWIWKLALIAVLYVLVYWTFGYFVAWRTPGLPEYYGGKDLGFLPGIAVTMRDTPWLPFFQLLRGLLWAGLAVVIIRMHKGGTFETSLAVGLAFSILAVAPLLLPNPIMGDVVAQAHLREVGSSNLLFGFLISLILLWKRK